MIVIRSWPVRGSARAMVPPGQWEPAADVLIVDGGVRIRIELAGVPRESIEVVAEGWRLVVRGQRPREAGDGECEYRQAEITYGPFCRVFEDFPFPLDDSEISARHADGLLTVTVRPRQAARRQVPVDGEG